MKTRHRTYEYLLYGAQLLVPALLVVDVLVSWALQPFIASRPMSDRILLTCTVMWLGAATVPLLFSRLRKSYLGAARKPTVYGCVVIALLLLAEATLRVGFPLHDAAPALREPSTSSDFVPKDSLIPVNGVSRFSVNEIGLRGPSVPQDRSIYRIVALGSSTTEGAIQDDSREWPRLLMDRLNARNSGVKVWVANAGVSGHTTVHNLEVLKTLPIFRHVDAVLLVVGQTDMGITLIRRGAPSQNYLDNDAALLRQSMLNGGKPVFDHPYYKRLRLYGLGKDVASTLLGKDKAKRWTDVEVSLAEWRGRRAAAPIRPLPPLDIGIDEYKARLRSLDRQCRSLNIRCVFATQPTLWRADLSPAELAHLWGGRLGQPRESEAFGYASAADLARAMRAWDEALLHTCSEQGLECYDLATRFPKSTELLYDDAHMTDKGAECYATLLEEYFAARPPFTKAAVAVATPVHNPSGR